MPLMVYVEGADLRGYLHERTQGGEINLFKGVRPRARRNAFQWADALELFGVRSRITM